MAPTAVTSHGLGLVSANPYGAVGVDHGSCHGSPATVVKESVSAEGRRSPRKQPRDLHIEREIVAAKSLRCRDLSPPGPLQGLHLL
jgi:hypothetical protein